MKSPVLILVLVSTLAALAAGCVPSTTRALAFEPRSYPFVPELGLDGPNGTNTAK
jgi:hypothetical protein